MDYQTSRMPVLGRHPAVGSMYSSLNKPYASAQRRSPEVMFFSSRRESLLSGMEPQRYSSQKMSMPEIMAYSSRLPGVEFKEIEMAALGRPLHLGRLYDCRNDSYITGVTLWNEAEMSQKVLKNKKPDTQTQITRLDSLRDKAKLLEVNASLKASLLGGLVEVGGSAKYLSDQKSSTNSARVTMRYYQTTRYERVNTSDLQITYPRVFEDKNATHVITAVLYGAQAFMVFDKMVSENNSVEKIEGSMEAMVRKIPSFSVEGKGSVNLNNEEKNLAESINCTFYGDYELKENPTTYEEALELYKKLPSLMVEENAVPIKVWLSPLASLESKAAKLERIISEDLINKVEAALEDLAKVEMRCENLLQNNTVNDFQDVKEKLQKFQELFGEYKSLFKKELRELLPAIRGGDENEQTLISIMHIHQTSPFRPKNLLQWLDNVQVEVNLLHQYASELSSVTSTITSPESFSSILSMTSVDTVICLSFTSLTDEDPFLSSLTPMVDDLKKLPTAPKTQSEQLNGVCWFNNPKVIKKMKENVLLFKNFGEANKNKPSTKFIIATIPDSANPGTSVRLYEKCQMVNGSYQPVSKPSSPTVDIQDQKVMLKFQKPPTGMPVKYRVEYRAGHSDAEAWEFKDTPDAGESFALTDLEMAHQYWVRYRAVDNVGMSEASDAVPFSIQGTVNVSVGESWDYKTSSLFNDVRTKIMTSLGISRWNLSTIDLEVSNRLSDISTPYPGTIPGGLKPGMAMYYQGVVHPLATYSNAFTIDHQSGADIAFHFKLDIKYNSALCNSERNKIWDTPLRPTKACPLTPGSAFDMFIVIKKEGYEVYINGEKFCQFEHRIPIEKVTTFTIYGDVFINTMGIVNNWSTSTFGTELSQENTRGKYSKVQSGEPYPVCNPSKPFSGPITGGLRAGRALFFQGIVSSDANYFTINLMDENSEDIAFHFSPRITTNTVVRDSHKGYWMSKEEPYGCPFVRGGAFDIFMVVKPENYKVIVNGHFFCEFKHRLPLETVTRLNINGDVFMNTFGICEVDKVKMSVIMPAHKGN